MDADAKKTALRMIPYGLYVLTAEGKDGKVAASTVNWVTQTAFQPPLVVVGVKTDSGAHAIIKESKSFALNILGKDQKGQAFTFFKPLEREGNSIGGEPFRKGSLGAPILEKAPGVRRMLVGKHGGDGRPFHLRRRGEGCGSDGAACRTAR
jgi:flavin reductase (DIM6/NTAB) family NADH-FMN oxidoreductase RutF